MVLRVALELAALFAVGWWGFATNSDGLIRIATGLLLPLAMATCWGVFRMANDGGAPVVEIGGRARLQLEMGYFALAVASLVGLGRLDLAIGLVVLLTLNYGLDATRTLDMLTGRR
ncbi:YrdB family protein [Devosia algicola]|uniref:YrdB family protein n=1 Tax=Devosia algicola TaxID=3026418 RepID=A0ABY7YKW6_9HYPH|nr:YrdB family protein [Devosia algicola]WDR01832.1 YrdB family protein [Devosia algicola]